MALSRNPRQEEASIWRKAMTGQGSGCRRTRPYSCSDDERFATILARYHLHVSAADKAAMTALVTHR